MQQKLACAIAAFAMLLPLVARAHHGWAAFDSQNNVTFKGVVTDFHFVSPHSVVDFEVKDANGKVEIWQGELTSALNLSRKGWTAVSLETGDEITVSGHKARSGVHTMRLMKLTTKKGVTLEAGDEK